MILLNTGGFFQGFNLDTLLALISCIAGVVALFLGGAAYSQCKIIKKSFNDEKKFEDESQDRSQRAAGDIINNHGITDSQLMTFTTALATLSKDNFSKVVDQAYETFRLQTDENMKQIIAETERIVSESKWQIAGYTKIDWINIYFESAKNASDPHMQKVWAKVLAVEVASPGTFSYKTLDVLKNMSSNEFKIFEKLASIEIHNAIIKGDYLQNFGLNWETLQRLKDFGLINLEGPTRTLTFEPKNTTFQVMRKSHALRTKNNTDEPKQLKKSCYLLTVPAQELLVVSSNCIQDDVAIEIAKEIIKADSENEFTFSLHKIDIIFPNGQFSYQPTNLLED